ncbi:MAG: DUF6134 family protein [Steroidobacteraceae bacterium]
MWPAGISTRLLGAALLLAASLQVEARSRSWDFQVFLGDAPIGYHQFTLDEQGERRELRSESRFAVKVLLFTAYRYEHDATELWRGDCLESLTARTNDNGGRPTVDARSDGERLAVATGKGRESIAGCVMSFAYWNPQILRQARLLNPQTGEYEAIKVTTLGVENITVRGVPVEAKRFRLTGSGKPIDLWYSLGDEWLALESTVAGGRRLRYLLN